MNAKEERTGPVKVRFPDLLTKGIYESVLRRSFPDVVFHIHAPLPWYVFGNPRAITIGNHVYFRIDEFHPWKPGGQALILHELFHVAQGANGFGFWFFRWFYVRYVISWVLVGFTTGRRHPMEAPAYRLQDEYENL